MRVGSLFSGIGGIDLGLERAGMKIAWQVENDDWCRRVLAKHWPDVERFGDIRDVGAHNLAAVDVLAGGFPCQPVSHAGKRQAQDDARWLWPEFARLVRELRPRYVFVENVPGLLDGPMADVLGDLAASGYDAEWDCIPAAAVGAPHLRDRVWLLAYGALNGRGPRWAGRSDSGDPWESECALSPVADATRQQDDGDDECPHRPVKRGRLAVGRAPKAAQQADGAASDDDAARCGEALADAIGERRRRRDTQREDATDVGEPSRRAEFGGWDVEPDVGRVAHGIPKRVDRLRGLGNAVVPQIVEMIGRRVVEAV